MISINLVQVYFITCRLCFWHNIITYEVECMLFRLVLGAGLLVIGYYVGREVARNEGGKRGLLHGTGRKARVKHSIVDSTDYKVTKNK